MPELVVTPSGRGDHPTSLPSPCSATLPRCRRRITKDLSNTPPRKIDKENAASNDVMSNSATQSNSNSSSRSFIRTCQKAKRIRFFRNGDAFFKGMWYAVAPDRFRSLVALMEDLTKSVGDLINLPHGVRLIFTVDGLRKINDLDELQDGESYVCSSNDVFKPLDYESVRPPVWNYATNIKSDSKAECSGLSLDLNGAIAEKNDFVSPRIITIIRKGVRPRRVVRLLLNKRTARSFHQVLCDITAAVKLDSGAVKRLFTLAGKPVTELVDFFGESDVFISSGSERLSIDDFYLDSEEYKLLTSIRGRINIAPVASDQTANFACKVPSLLRYDLSGNRPSPAARRRFLHQRNQRKLRPRRRKSPANDFDTPSTPRGDSDSTPSTPKLPQTPKDEVKNGLQKKFSDGEECHPPDMLSRFDFCRFIGDGCFAVVYECKCKKTGDPVALKVIDKAKCAGKEELVENEVSLLRRSLHPNIVQLHNVWDFPHNFYMSMELVNGGDLFDCLVSARHLAERDASFLLADLSSALQYLHDNNIVHRDVKPENLLIFESEERKRLKLADFGLAAETNRVLFTVCGTPTYVAPEILCETGYGTKVDVWASGVILYIMLCGFPPFISMQNSQEELFDMILSGEFNFPSPYWDRISPAAKGLIQGMLLLDVEDRYAAAQVLMHPWVTGEAQLDENDLAMEGYADHGLDIDVCSSQASRSFWDKESVEFFYSRRRSMDDISTQGDYTNANNDQLSVQSNSPL